MRPRLLQRVELGYVVRGLRCRHLRVWVEQLRVHELRRRALRAWPRRGDVRSVRGGHVCKRYGGHGVLGLPRRLVRSVVERVQLHVVPSRLVRQRGRHKLHGLLQRHLLFDVRVQHVHELRCGPVQRQLGLVLLYRLRRRRLCFVSGCVGVLPLRAYAAWLCLARCPGKGTDSSILLLFVFGGP